MKPISPTDAWDLLTAASNPVPSDVVGAMSALGIEVLREVSGENSTEYLARCPAHLALTGKPDRRPSFSVNGATGLAHCFSCGYSGQFIDLVEDALGYDRVTACQWIVRRGVYRTSEETTPTLASADEKHAVTEASLALFVSPPREACDRRGITPEAARDLGVLWNEEKRRWILPIRDPFTGELWGWQEKGKRFFRNYPAGVHKGRTLFGDLNWSGHTALLLESPLDAARAHALGIPGAFASFGAHVSEAQMRLLKARCQQLVLGLDNDHAGRTSRDRLYARWRPRGLSMRFLDYGGTTAKDLGDMTDDAARSAFIGAYHPWRR
ncbi:toprim domain-containing protein [Streptomyces malaysiensis]|uniref:DNA primase n=1 Tax=Streptomyces malaysiensis TaxID=92644 RepID=A0A7X6AZR1_STRMQ|nr:toprim domain-containing protein [Streptomyces malaysiensis]NIY68030.1 DNA primase [Streptomyces malaysiensis]